MAESILGKIIGGKYRLRSVLGQGAQGIVYRAEQLDSEGQVLRDVALKMVRPELSGDLGFAQQFLHEVRITASLHNPHIVTVYDTGRTEGGQLYCVMELV